MKKLILLSVLLSANAQAETWWLNIPSHYSPVTDKYVPSMSLLTFSYEQCREGIISYTSENFVNYIGCDVRPLRDAVNLSPTIKKYY